jgi:beta-N-acetylhexosaminidase
MKAKHHRYGALFSIGFDGTALPPRAHELFVDHGIGGAILFRRNIESLEQVVALNTSLFELGKGATPLMVSVDQEGGRVARLRGIMTDVPSMRAVGQAAKADPELAQRTAAMMGRELVALGFHWDFAPVVDVDTNPDNPVIGERSFATDAQTVGRLGAAFVRGLQGSGVAASAKHFPGHGDTDTDSHHALPTLNHDLDRLRRIELVPFKEAIAAGVASIMTAHVMFPALDAELPATLSPAILNTLLRQELGYDGVVVSDDLEMAAVADRYPIEELVRLGLLAGVDHFLICHDHDKAEAAVRAVRAHVESGAVPRARVEEALARVARLKRRYVGAPAAPDLGEARKLVRCGPHVELAARFADVAAATADGRQASPVDLG